jgi:hypothetical protein
VPRASGYPWPECGSANKTFEANSKYQGNLGLVAASLPKKASTYPNLFAAAVAGAAPDRVWAMGLCRGDSNAAACFDCLTQGFRDLPNACAYAKEATMYYDACILHYSDARVLSAGDTGPSTDTFAFAFQVNVTSDQARFNRVVAGLMNATAEYAAFNSTRRFATGEADFDQEQEIPKVYSLAQCTPDQTPTQCRKCLAGIIASTLGEFFQNDIAPRALWVSCNYRYEIEPFYNGPAMVQLASSTPADAAPASAPAVQPEMRPPPPPARGGEFFVFRVWTACLLAPTETGPCLLTDSLAYRGKKVQCVRTGSCCHAASSSRTEPCRLPLFPDAAAATSTSEAAM